MHTAPFQLSTWQKKQVTLLYHFASLDYLRGLQQKMHALLGSIDPTLDLAKLQRRDGLLTDARWGTRNTSENWANNGWPLLVDFEASIAKDIAKRAFETYSVTGTDHCAGGLEELSLDWMTGDEQENFESSFEKLSLYAMNIDYTMDQRGKAGRWKDFNLALRKQEYSEIIDQAPSLRLRPDITGMTGMFPVRTGVYLPTDDHHGTPQFCWTGTPAGKLLECNTFNDLGLEALAAVGRSDLWVNEKEMYLFVQDHLNDPRLNQDSHFARSASKATLAPSLVARNAFTSRSCSWIYVEQIHGELENWNDSSLVEMTMSGPRVEAGSSCTQPGYYFTPAKANSRRFFSKGELMPHVGGDYGKTIWQWDNNQ